MLSQMDSLMVWIVSQLFSVEASAVGCITSNRWENYILFLYFLFQFQLLKKKNNKNKQLILNINVILNDTKTYRNIGHKFFLQVFVGF